MSSFKLTELPIVTAATNGDVLYLVNNYVPGDPVLTGDSKQISVSAFSESIIVNAFPYTGSPTINGSLSVTGTINQINVSKGGGSAEQNTAVGLSALSTNTWDGGDNGNYNTAFGSSALSSNETGFGNTAAGTSSLLSNALGSENSGLGFQTMFFNYFASGNTAIGSRALQVIGSAQPTPQNYNTALGTDAGRFINTGGTASMSTSTNSIFLGYRAISTAQTLTNQIVIGHLARGRGSNTTSIGNPSTTSLFLGGNPGEGIVMRSPNGTRYRVTIANGGSISINAF